MLRVVHYYKGPINSATRMLQQALSVSDDAHVTVFCMQERPEVSLPIPLWNECDVQVVTLLPLDNSSFMIGTIRACLNWIRRFRLILSLLFTPSDILHLHQHTGLSVGVLWQWFRRAPVVYDAHDILHHELQHKGFRRSRKLEQKLLGKGASVVAVCEGMRDYLLDKYPGSNVFILPSLPPQNDLVLSPSVQGVCPSAAPALHTYRLRIAYAGLIAENRIPCALIELVAKIPDVLLDIYGYSNGACRYDEKIKQYVAQHGVSNIRIRGRYRPDEITAIFSQYHFLVMLYRLDNENMRFCLPNKLFQALSAALPLIVTKTSDLGSIVQRSGAGLVSPYDDLTALQTIFLHFNAKSEMYVSMKKSVSRLADRMLNYEQYHEQILSIYNRVQPVNLSRFPLTRDLL